MLDEAQGWECRNRADGSVCCPALVCRHHLLQLSLAAIPGQWELWGAEPNTWKGFLALVAGEAGMPVHGATCRLLPHPSVQGLSAAAAQSLRIGGALQNIMHFWQPGDLFAGPLKPLPSASPGSGMQRPAWAGAGSQPGHSGRPAGLLPQTLHPPLGWAGLQRGPSGEPAGGRSHSVASHVVASLAPRQARLQKCHRTLGNGGGGLGFSPEWKGGG